MNAMKTLEQVGKSGRWNPANLPGLFLMVAAVFFFPFTLVGKWSAGAGIGARLFPQLSLIVMFFSGFSVFAIQSKNHGCKYKDVSPLRVTFFMGLAVLFVLAVLNIGLAVGTFLYMFANFFQFGKEGGIFTKVFLPALVVTIFIWGLFTYFVQIVLPPVLLF